MFMMYILIAIMAVFKSYPSYADTALYLAMLPMWKHTLNCKSSWIRFETRNAGNPEFSRTRAIKERNAVLRLYRLCLWFMRHVESLCRFIYFFATDLRNSLVVTMMYVVCTVLAPILWHLWIYAGSANANFYFAITLVYSTAQVSRVHLIMGSSAVPIM